MNIILDLTIVPMGVGLSLSGYVATCQRILKEAGLKHTLHANGTNIEGDWDAVFAAVKRCHQELHRMGVNRIHTDIRLGTRIDKSQTMADKLKSVKEKLRE
ncbi:MAG: MTH1187 family thiamine-binding protein [Anaerolineales bacterium]|nr:MTH1187 family thiamine-binding protein [Anaerolineales bacterium]